MCPNKRTRKPGCKLDRSWPSTSDGFPVVPVRDSKRPEGNPVVCSREAWAAFVASAQGGRFDV
ncbi:DUF397 domain-containing protein [Streptomyces sp. TRM 70351]|uniref:DUF397 domain-containing protein n=1 Tax=Streptomyces sp. TRM 70351 TaxID=3116552 RepID=UPI002E7B2AF2|nr:DUF397 domain-containing protein [Streptomyces sp. TRM 70351]MEE1928480.1 DUF397 domain-containing protein [Streptomyces sp. TRM 70351]